ncbi:Gfo/Idh/MocA family oxidoreductase [Ruegeria sp. 2205SS24-7]|uniref:Gfo/Idh/MocA family protein n=1 Tax=Ruegeria discodermiae TaxID=3064389 RepID=UPI002740B59F|nr:Gfo/Idh/MocA family oxidoreductase [Ruegeria sp. 2205SS24-7]MDP5220211.1 Gfo/Idh/MocA family oxidoreductase [Ruegeria sp. 2205SS24-7]
MPDATSIAVVGFGLIGRRHADVVQRSPDLSLAAVVDPDGDSRNAAIELGAQAFASLDEMFDTVTPDGLVLATPTPMHLDQGLACIARGCPVLIEKPIAVTSTEAGILTDAAEAAGVPLLVGHHRRHNGMVRAAKALLADGAIGDIRAVQATCWFYKPDHYFQAAPWRMRKGAGPISVNLVHDVDLLRHFCGEVRSVQAIAVPSARGFENEDLATAILTFAGGAVATISVSDSIVAPWSWELTSRENPAYPATNESCYLIGGSEGGLSLPDLRVWRHEPTPDWWTPISAKSVTCGSEDPLATQMHHFAEVIQGIETPLVSGRQGKRSLEVVEAIAVSAQTGAEVCISDATDAKTGIRKVAVKIQNIRYY